MVINTQRIAAHLKNCLPVNVHYPLLHGSFVLHFPNVEMSVRLHGDTHCVSAMYSTNGLNGHSVGVVTAVHETSESAFGRSEETYAGRVTALLINRNRISVRKKPGQTDTYQTVALRLLLIERLA